MVEPIASPTPIPIQEFEGVKTQDPALSGAIARALANAELLVGRSRGIQDIFGDARLGLAAVTSLAAANSLLMAATAECQLDSPPREIDVVNGPGGDLILVCRHSPSHKWNLSGGMLP
ncbi:MAG: hypothetical protein J0I45_19485 [Bosea sp.]|nr:hypothetical protein [Bosea sp. (in: a-proteobacteria)]